MNLYHITSPSGKIWPIFASDQWHAINIVRGYEGYQWPVAIYKFKLITNK
jgi:hypothetical protein